MSLLHPALLYGLLLAAVPVVLHLLMRARPKKIDFPALRLLENIRKQNSQRMRLRHIGLLLLRILILVLLVLAVTRPTLPAANYGLTSSEWGTGIVVLLIAVAAYFLGRKYWVRKVEQKHVQSWRESWLKTGTAILALLLMLLLVGLPYQKRVYSEIRNPGEQLQLNVPVAAVFLFDVSASMGYRHENRNRLEQAQELALTQVRSFPSGSRVSITDNATAKPIRFLKDLNAAVARLQRRESLRPHDASLLLNDRLLSAIQLQTKERQKLLDEGEGKNSDRFLREIYIYTDRVRSAWSLDDAKRLKAEIEQAPWLRCYIIDVGVQPVNNISLSHLSLSQSMVIQGSIVRVSAEVTNQNLRTIETVAELYLDDGNGSLVKRDQTSLTLEAKQTGQASFSIKANSLGIIQGEIRLAQSDPLKIDNVIAFSLRVEPRPKVLIVAEKAEEAFVWEQALAPAGLVKRGVHQYEVKVVSPSKLLSQLKNNSSTSPTKPDVIYLMNVSRLTEKTWNALQEFVEQGGGLGVILGRGKNWIDVENYRDFDQTDWLAALPSVETRPVTLKKIEVTRDDHPVFSYLKELNVLSLFSSAAVRRFWKTDITDGAITIANFNDEERSPAIVVRNYGRGRVLSLSTAVDLRRAAEQQNWSDLARLDWIYAAWADQMTKYLQGGRNLRLNRTVGEPVVLSLPESRLDKQALLQLPGLRQNKITIPFQGTLLNITVSNNRLSDSNNNGVKKNRQIAADRIGNYRLLFPGGAMNSYGFSLQLPDKETDLQPLSYAELDELFGENRWQLSRTYEELERTVLLGRIGKEAYPMLITLLILFFLGEHLAANFFYGRQES